MWWPKPDNLRAVSHHTTEDQQLTNEDQQLTKHDLNGSVDGVVCYQGSLNCKDPSSSALMMVNRRAPDTNVSQTPVPINQIRKAKTKLVQIMSQNVCGLKSNDRVEELTMALQKRDIFAACLQETWRIGIEFIDCNNYITHSFW